MGVLTLKIIPKFKWILDLTDLEIYYEFIMDINWILTLKLVPTSLNVKQPHNELSILECPKNLNIWLVLSQLINNLVFCVPNHH